MTPLVWRHHHVHRIPHPTFVTIAKRPSCEHETREEEPLICPSGEAKYFRKQDWTRSSLICPSGKSAATSMLVTNF
jgi:hypothetical protein